MYETRVLGKHCPAKVSPEADRFSIQTGVQIEIDPATITDVVANYRPLGTVLWQEHVQHELVL